MSLSDKLWIMWGVMAASTVVVGIASGNFQLTMGFAVVAAAAGWAAFLTRK